MSIIGEGMRYYNRGDPAAWDFGVGDFTCDGTYRDLDLSAIVPAGAKLIHISVQFKDDAASRLLAFRKNGDSNVVARSLIYTQVANVNQSADMLVACDQNRVIEYIVTTAVISTLNVVVRGWFE